MRGLHDKRQLLAKLRIAGRENSEFNQIYMATCGIELRRLNGLDLQLLNFALDEEIHSYGTTISELYTNLIQLIFLNSQCTWDNVK